jgi:pimeloyl-ACP methyl ester carboxylesterase
MLETPSPVAHTPEHFADANGQRLCWDSFGNPSHPALLLIMGLGAQMVLWDDDFCEILARHGFYVMRFDNRDIGRSAAFTNAAVDLHDIMQRHMRGEPISAPYLLRDMAADAAALLTALGIARAHVVGASMGGMIAQEMAINHADRLLSLTSIMSTTGDPKLPPPLPEAVAVMMTPPPRDRDEYIRNFCRNWIVLRAGRFPEDEARDPARAARFWERGLNPLGVTRQMAAIFASGDRTPALQGVNLPALVIHGAADPLVPLTSGRATAAAIPGARMIEVPGMGHAIPVITWPQIIGAIADHCSAAGR